MNENDYPGRLNYEERSASSVYSFIEPRLNYLLSLPKEEQQKQRELGKFWGKRRRQLGKTYHEIILETDIVPYHLFALEQGLLSNNPNVRESEIIRMEFLFGKMPETIERVSP